MPEDWQQPSEENAHALRWSFGSFATGVTVVAAAAEDGTIRAFTANSFTSVSLKPPLLLVCLAKSLGSFEHHSKAELFSVNVLSADQHEISNAFASRDPDAKAAAAEKMVDGKAPYLPGNIATFICERHEVVDAGDHLILIGRVLRFQSQIGEPLCFYRGSYVGLGPDFSEIEETAGRVLVGAVLGQDGKVLLSQQAGRDDWDIPCLALRRGETHVDVLKQLFGQFDIELLTAIPYSLFQDPTTNTTTLIFAAESERIEVTGNVGDDSTIRLFDRTEAPWTLIKEQMKSGLVRRYFEEMERGLRGIYLDTLESGEIFPVQSKGLRWSDWTEGKSLS